MFEKRIRGARSLVLGAVTASFLAAVPSTAGADDAAGVRKWTPTTLAADIKAGQHVLLLQQVSETDSMAAAECDVEGALSDSERQQAEHIGAALARYGVPIAEVRSSSRCTARATARALGLGEASVDERLDPVAADAVDATEVDRLRRSVTLDPPADANVLLVSHGGNVDRLLKVTTKAPPGTLHVFRRIDGRFTYLGSVAPTDWKPAEGS